MSLRPSCFLLALAVAPACVAESGDNSMLILFNQVPVASDSGCSIPEGDSGQFRQSGLMDVTAPDIFSAVAYEFYPVVESRVMSLGDETQRTITVRGAEVELTASDGSLSDEFSRVFSGSIRPGGQTTFSVLLLDADHLQQLSLGADETVTVIASVKIFGDLQGGEIESDRFDYPIDVCNGCLISSLGDCSTVPASFVPRSGGECNPFQDALLDCCTVNDEQICPAVGLSSSG